MPKSCFVSVSCASGTAGLDTSECVFCLISLDYCLEVLGVNKMFCHTCLCFLSVISSFNPGTFPWIHFSPVSFLLLNNELWLQPSQMRSAVLHMLSSSFMTWMSGHCVLSHFGWKVTLRQAYHQGSPFVDNGPRCGFLGSKNFRNNFNLSRLIHVGHFVFHLFLNVFI